MNLRRIERALAATLDDLRMSRAERSAVARVIADIATDEHDLEVIRSRAFRLAREAVPEGDARRVVEWLEELMRILAGSRAKVQPRSCSEVHFSPGSDCADRLVKLFDACRRRADVCVFTITDDRLARSIARAHRRGVIVRIITDDEKTADRGSDIAGLWRVGVAVAVDRSTAHMHHKFALFDQQLVATGSYNWTRSAAEENQENLVVTDDPDLVGRFAAEFERLWLEFTEPPEE